MKVLFVLKEVGLTEPLGIMYLSSALKKAGHRTYAIQFEKERNPLSKISMLKPDIIAYSITTGFHKYYLELNREIKQRFKNIITIFGGPHPTFFPEIIDNPFIDAICIGEGEEAIVDFVNTFEEGQFPKKVQNVWIKEEGKVYKNPVRPLVRNIDDISSPDRDVIYEEDRYLAEYPIKHFINLRGCPFNCTYCFNHTYRGIYSENGGYPVRYHSIDRIIDEVNDVKNKYGVGLVRFLSDVFITKKSWLKEFSKRFPIEVGLPFSCNIRADLIDEETAYLLKRAGCVSVLMGIESSNDSMRMNVLGRIMSKETIVSAVNLLKDNRIAIYSQNMIGLPGETFKMALDTLRFNSQLKTDFAWASIFTPYPRTKLGEYAKKYGYFNGNYDTVNFSYHTKSCLDFKNKSDRRRIENLHKLFSFSSRFMGFQRQLDILCDMPRNPFYWFIYNLWYGYALRSYIFPVHFGFRRFVKSIFRLFRKDEG
ncbi:MAG: B12-binding domain-containing radical SAM protein [bacterium]